MTILIPVPLPQTPYTVAIEAGGIDRLGDWLTGEQITSPLGKKALVVSSTPIFRHYGDRVIASLTQAGFSVAHHLIAPGERYKTLSSVQRILDSAAQHQLERSSVMVALGGGVIGDMTGFAAACWLRGIAVVQVPTSLLAMVDASIGGKTGVNHAQGKNLIGAFHQPRFVLIDPEVLKTLPAREFRAGMAEVIKYGIIWDVDLFSQMEAAQRLDEYRLVKGELLETLLERSCQAKAAVVSQDEKEAGLRAILNYGHTLGHGIETVMNYRGVNHGEGVALGMIGAGHIALQLGKWDASAVSRQQAVIAKAKLPTQLPETIDREAVIQALQWDKKVKDGQVRFILPTAIGQVELCPQVPESLIRSVLQQL
ncbi:MAG: 3-dehydroquinate synthase [Prochlorotrichaceae cyanobacterium]|jgi:3-dehydroquinate synthase